ncbi:uncharacterized protein Dvar_56710 [Desulfosarcina variabilis str. Montpellier]
MTEEITTKAFPNDKYIMPNNFISGSFDSTEDFVEKILKKKNSLIYYFNWLHRCYMAIGLILIIFVFQLESVCK